MGKNAQPHGNAVIYKSISYICCYEEAGMIETEPGVYSRAVKFIPQYDECYLSLYCFPAALFHKR